MLPVPQCATNSSILQISGVLFVNRQSAPFQSNFISFGVKQHECFIALAKIVYGCVFSSLPNRRLLDEPSRDMVPPLLSGERFVCVLEYGDCVWLFEEKERSESLGLKREVYDET